MGTPRIIAACAALLFITLIVGWLWKAAGDEVRNQVERQNNAAGNNADRARSDFDACPAVLWDFETSRCRRP